MRTTHTPSTSFSTAPLFIFAVAVIGAWLTMTPVSAAAQQQLTAAEVVGLPFDRDGETITFEGEAIGDVLSGGAGHSWINVGSGGVALGVWAPRKMIQIRWLGRYGTVGDTLRVRGTYNTACDQHGGDMDVHAISVEVVEVGRAVSRPAQWWKLAFAVALAAVGGIVTVRYRRIQSKAGEF